MSAELPPCGLYRTTKPIGSIEVDRLVYFHNHGNPGPGFYFPESWSHNRAKFSANGMTAPDGWDPKAIMPLPAEGFYRIATEFYCCDKKCAKFEPDGLVQLGYNGTGRAILFVPEAGGSGLVIPERGSMIDDKVLPLIQHLRVAVREQRDDLSLPRGMIVH